MLTDNLQWFEMHDYKLQEGVLFSEDEIPVGRQLVKEYVYIYTSMLKFIVVTRYLRNYLLHGTLSGTFMEFSRT